MFICSPQQMGNHSRLNYPCISVRYTRFFWVLSDFFHWDFRSPWICFDAQRPWQAFLNAPSRFCRYLPFLWVFWSGIAEGYEDLHRWMGRWRLPRQGRAWICHRFFGRILVKMTMTWDFQVDASFQFIDNSDSIKISLKLIAWRDLLLPPPIPFRVVWCWLCQCVIANSDRFFMVFLQYWNLSTFVRFGTLHDIFPKPWPWHEQQGETSWWDSATWGRSCAWVGSVGRLNMWTLLWRPWKKTRAMGASALLINFCVCACLLSTILFIFPYLILSTLSLSHTGPPRARNVEDVLALMRLEIWDPASFISSNLCTWWGTFWYIHVHAGCPKSYFIHTWTWVDSASRLVIILSHTLSLGVQLHRCIHISRGWRATVHICIADDTLWYIINV